MSSTTVSLDASLLYLYNRIRLRTIGSRLHRYVFLDLGQAPSTCCCIALLGLLNILVAPRNRLYPFFAAKEVCSPSGHHSIRREIDLLPIRYPFFAALIMSFFARLFGSIRYNGKLIFCYKAEALASLAMIFPDNPLSTPGLQGVFTFCYYAIRRPPGYDFPRGHNPLSTHGVQGEGFGHRWRKDSSRCNSIFSVLLAVGFSFGASLYGAINHQARYRRPATAVATAYPCRPASPAFYFHFMFWTTANAATVTLEETPCLHSTAPLNTYTIETDKLVVQDMPSLCDPYPRP